ncbi:MAG: amidohydrolase family protein [Myxococcota bacterium]
MHDHPTTFPSIRALSRLPWFELRDDGLLGMADPDVGPVVDSHTHLALAFASLRQVDLQSSPGPTEHYLSMERPLDFDVYVNRNFTEDDLGRMKRDLSLKSMTAGGMRRTHTIPNLLREMRALGVARSVLLPIELPKISRNAETWLEVTRDEEELVCFGSVHPYDKDIADRLARQKEMGARGVKIHPATQLITPDHPRAQAVYRVCADLDLPVLWHCGPVDIEPAAGRYCSQVKHYWPAIHHNPDTTFLLGHSGAMQVELGLQLAKTYPNVWLELSSQSLPSIRRILEEGPADRIVFGTDWPFYPLAIQLAKVLIATEDDPGMRRRVLRDNASRLLGLGDLAEAEAA